MLGKVLRRSARFTPTPAPEFEEIEKDPASTGHVLATVEEDEGGEEEAAVTQPHTAMARLSLDDDAVDDYGAEDIDGMRQQRARLSLDDAKIRGNMANAVQNVPGSETEEETPCDPKDALENFTTECEGVLLTEAGKVPVQIGTCGEAGREPFRKEGRNSLEEVRKENQDAYLAIAPFFGNDQQMLFSVCDGHGEEGRSASHVVRSALSRELRSNTETPAKDGEEVSTECHRRRAKILADAFLASEKELMNPARNIGHLYSGTTCVLTWVIGSDMYCSWAGDSRAVLGRNVANLNGEKRYRPIELTYDHKPSRHDEKLRVRASGGRIARWRKNVGPQRVWLPTDWVPGLAMTRSIGDTLLTEFGVCPMPEITYTRLGHDDSFIVLASDGVWEFMSSQEVVEFVGKRKKEMADPNTVAQALVQEATRRWRRNEVIVDDTTAIVIYLGFDGAPGKQSVARKNPLPFSRMKKTSRPALVRPSGELAAFAVRNEG